MTKTYRVDVQPKGKSYWTSHSSGLTYQEATALCAHLETLTGAKTEIVPEFTKNLIADDKGVRS